MERVGVPEAVQYIYIAGFFFYSFTGLWHHMMSLAKFFLFIGPHFTYSHAMQSSPNSKFDLLSLFWRLIMGGNCIPNTICWQ